MRYFTFSFLSFAESHTAVKHCVCQKERVSQDCILHICLIHLLPANVCLCARSCGDWRLRRCMLLLIYVIFILGDFCAFGIIIYSFWEYCCGGIFLLNELFGMLSNTLDKNVEKLKINEISHASAAMCCFGDAHVEQSSLSFLSLCLATVSIPWWMIAL